MPTLCLERLRELEKEIGWEGEAKKDRTHLPVIHVTHTKKELKKIKKEDKVLIKKTKISDKVRYRSMLGEFDQETVEDIITQYGDDYRAAIEYMKYLNERIETAFEGRAYYESIDDYVVIRDSKVSASIDPIIASGMWDSWQEYVDKHPDLSMVELHNRRKKFRKIYQKKQKKMRKKYKSFEMYDPLFRMRKIDDVELKKSLKAITKENMERRNRFLEVIGKSCMQFDPYLMKSFKERTKAANKALNRYIIDMNKSASYSGELDDYGLPYESGPMESFEIPLGKAPKDLADLLKSNT